MTANNGFRNNISADAISEISEIINWNNYKNMQLFQSIYEKNSIQ